MLLFANECFETGLSRFLTRTNYLLIGMHFKLYVVITFNGAKQLLMEAVSWRLMT